MLKKGFRNYVQVYDETFYVNTFTGEGFDKVLVKMDPLFRKMASSIYIPGYNFEDIKSELTIIALEGIQAFDPDRNVRLSTFLQTHLHNKIISWIRSENRMSNDATSLSKDENSETKIKKIRNEINFSQFDANKDNDSMAFENTISNDGGLHSSGISNYDLVDFETSLLKISSKLDPKTRRIIELVYFEDYSIKDAAETVGLSGWAASMRLKKLAMRGTFKTMFEQEQLDSLIDASEFEELPEN